MNQRVYIHASDIKIENEAGAHNKKHGKMRSAPSIVELDAIFGVSVELIWPNNIGMVRISQITIYN